MIGYIYLIRSNETDKFYIGSTMGTLEKRLKGHKNHYIRYLGGEDHYYSSFEILQHQDAYIELFEACKVESKSDLQDIEGIYIKNCKEDINCVNMIIANHARLCGGEKEYRTQYHKENAEKRAQYLKENKEKIKEQKAQYRKRNAEKIKEQEAQYRKENAEKIKENNAKYQKENKEKLKQKQAQYQKENAEKLKQKKAQYRKENTEKIKQQDAKYRKENAERIKQKKAEYRLKIKLVEE